MRTKNSVLNVVVGIFSLLITTITGFVLSKIFITNMGIEKNGLNSLFINVMSILSISELGIAGAINYNLYKPILNRDYTKVSIIMTFYKKCYRVIGSLILVMSIIMAFFINNFIKGSTLSEKYIIIAFLLFSLNTITTYFFAYARNLLYGFQQVFIASAVDFFSKLLKTILQIFLIIKYKNYYLYLIVNVIFDLLANIIIYLLCRKKFPLISFNEEKRDKKLENQVFHDVKSLSVIQVTNAVINFTDSIIISKFVGIIQTGLFANYKLIVSQLNNLINTVFNGLGASIGNLLAENNEKRVKINLVNLQYFCFFLGTVCFSGILLFTQPFITLWIGKEYLLSFSVVILIAINLYITVQRQVITYFLRTGGYHNRMIIPTIIEAILNFIISIVLVFKYDVIGVLIGTVFSAIFGFFANSILLYRIYKFNYLKYIVRQIKFILYSVIILIITKLIFSLFNFSVLLNFVLMLITYMIVVIIIFVIIFMIEPDLLSIRDSFQYKLKVYRGRKKYEKSNVSFWNATRSD